MESLLTVRGAQNNYSFLYGAKGDIVWDIYSEDDKNVLVEKIKYMFPDLGTVDSSLNVATKEQQQENKRREIENQKIENYRKQLVDRIWAQRKYCNGQLLMTIFYVALVRIENDLKKIEHLNKAIECDKFTVHPVFRIRKCIVENNSDGCCMVFVDENLRVYENWMDFKKNNKYCEGIIVAPRNGIYSTTNEEVDLECFLSSSATIPGKILKITDVAVNTTALIGSGVFIAALFTPIVAAPLMLGAFAISAGSGAYGIVRSSVNLADRGTHEQTINITDKDARSSWLGIATGAVGVASMGASQAVKILSTGQAITTTTKVVINGANIASMTVNGMGIANGIYDIAVKIHRKDPLTFMDCLQLSTSLVLFTHSLYNFKLVSKMTTSSSESFMNSLANRQREFFQNLSTKTKNFFQTKFDGIRSINSIPDFPQYFQETMLQSIGDIAPLLNIINGFAQSPSTGELITRIVLVVGKEATRKLIEIAREFLEQHSKKFEEFENFIFADRIIMTIFKTAQILFGIEKVTCIFLSQYNRKIILYALEHLEVLMNNIKEAVLEVAPTMKDISSITDLRNAMIHIFENVSVNVAKQFINLIKQLFIENQNYIQHITKRIVSFEEFLWVAFKVSISIANAASNLNEVILSMNPEDIAQKIKNYYKMYEIKFSQKIKCRTCIGYYSKMQMA